MTEKETAIKEPHGKAIGLDMPIKRAIFLKKSNFVSFCKMLFVLIGKPLHDASKNNLLVFVVFSASSAILLRTRTPIRASVFWFSKLRVLSLSPMTLSQRPICVYARDSAE